MGLHAAAHRYNYENNLRSAVYGGSLGMKLEANGNNCHRHRQMVYENERDIT